MVTMQSPPCVAETDDEGAPSASVHHRHHRRSAGSTALGSLSLLSRGYPLSSPKKSVASSLSFVQVETRGDVSSGNSSTGVTPSGGWDVSTRVALAVPSEATPRENEVTILNSALHRGCRCRIALLNANTESRMRIAASRDAVALADCAGVITKDSYGWRTLYIPENFCRSLHGSLEEELSALYGVYDRVHYDEIEGADHLPHAEKGQGGVLRDRSTVSAFQKMSDDEKISWLLENSFFVDPDESEHDDAAMADESSGQTAAVCADSSTTSLVVAEEGNAISNVVIASTTGDDDCDERIEFGDDGGFLPDGDKNDHFSEARFFGECAAASSSSPLGGTALIPSLGGGNSAIEIAKFVANSCKDDGSGTMDLVTRDDPSGETEDLPALRSRGESLIGIIKQYAGDSVAHQPPVVTEAPSAVDIALSILEPAGQSTKKNEQVLSQAGEGDNNIHPSIGRTEGLSTLETGGSPVVDIFETAAAIGSETEGLPRIEIAGVSPADIAASVVAGRNDTYPAGYSVDTAQ